MLLVIVALGILLQDTYPALYSVAHVLYGISIILTVVLLSLMFVILLVGSTNRSTNLPVHILSTPRLLLNIVVNIFMATVAFSQGWNILGGLQVTIIFLFITIHTLRKQLLVNIISQQTEN